MAAWARRRLDDLDMGGSLLVWVVCGNAHAPTEGGPRPNGRSFLSGMRGVKDVSACRIRAKIIFKPSKNLCVRGARCALETSGAPGFPPVFDLLFITRLSDNVMCLERVIGRSFHVSDKTVARNVRCFWSSCVSMREAGEQERQDLISVASLLFSEERLVRGERLCLGGCVPVVQGHH